MLRHGAGRIPTKLYDSLSMGCPVIVSAAGEASKEGAALGALCTPPGDAPALAEALRQLAALDKDALRELGESGKAEYVGLKSLMPWFRPIRLFLGSFCLIQTKIWRLTPSCRALITLAGR